NVRPKTVPKKEGELDPKFWEILLSTDKKDYERICSEYGVTDFRWMLKKLNEIKRQREEQQAEFVKSISNLKHIEIKPSCTALFEVDLDLVDPSSRIFIYKDGEMIEYSKDMKMKHSLKQMGNKFVFTIKDLLHDDAGLYQLDVENVTMFSTEFKIPKVEFLVKIQEVKAMEREDAVFECVLSNPFSKILWVGKNVLLEQGEKYDITVSEDKLIHRLMVKDCMLVDKGIYAAVAGIRSCNAWLIVEADSDPNLHGKKKVRKTTQAGGSGLDLAKIVSQQQSKLQKEKEEMISDIKTTMPEKDSAASEDSNTPISASGSGTGSVSEGGSAFECSSGLGSSASQDIGRTGAPVEETRSDLVKSGDNANLTSATRNAKSLASSKESCQNDCLTSQLPENAAHGKPPTFVTRHSVDRMNGSGSNDSEKHLEVPSCKNASTPILTNQSDKDTNSDEKRFAANISNSQATITAGDVPQFDSDELHKFSKPVVVKAGQNATFKMTFPPQDSLEIKWFKDGSKLMDGGGVKVVKETNNSRLQIKDCLQSDAGEIKIQLKNLSGTAEAISRLIVL
ncbi:immunoglobulin-like and fibronectin type III domain-containing protein 1, partial [Tachysurus ichikawai]